jgi:hypothetical protein
MLLAVPIFTFLLVFMLGNGFPLWFEDSVHGVFADGATKDPLRKHVREISVKVDDQDAQVAVANSDKLQMIPAKLMIAVTVKPVVTFIVEGAWVFLFFAVLLGIVVAFAEVLGEHTYHIAPVSPTAA